MVEGLINTFEELKKYVFIINRKDKGIIYIIELFYYQFFQ